MEADEAVRLRRAINKLARRFNTSATDEGLTPTQASVLNLIAGRGPIAIGELQRLEHINPTMLSRVVGHLDDTGLIVRTPDPDDLRSASLIATEAGQRVHERILAQRAETVSRSAKRLSPGEHAHLIQALPALERLAEETE
ncbi:MAG TPA: MarR family transcriptional regulator [Streptosporangiaceae bacterium]|nr:MarR family transcriptional regulator [Streptosporangiaceae bacterium]